MTCLYFDIIYILQCISWYAPYYYQGGVTKYFSTIYTYIVLVLVLTVVSYDNNHGNTNRDPMSENKRLNYLFVNYSLYYSKYLAIYH